MVRGSNFRVVGFGELLVGCRAGGVWVARFIGLSTDLGNCFELMDGIDKLTELLGG